MHARFCELPSAKAAVDRDYRNLQEAGNTSALDTDWDLWKKLQKLKVFAKDDQLPADYQQMARQVIAHAKELYRHPGPLADAAQHAQILLNQHGMR